MRAIKESPREEWAKKQEKYRLMHDSNPKKQEYLEFVRKYNATLTSEMESEIKGATKESILAKIVLAGSSAAEPENPTADDFRSHFFDDNSLSSKAAECFKELQNAKLILPDSASKSLPELIDFAKTLITLSEEMKNSMSDGSKKSLRAAKNIVSELLTSQDGVIRKLYESKKGSEETLAIPYDPLWAKKIQGHAPINIAELAEDEAKARKAINLPWQKGVYGREDPSKPYFTPWKPRPFLSPFAILPHHIEVSFKTCHAVYLRDPVARPGQSEVISPFGMPVHERAYMYYVRNGK